MTSVVDIVVCLIAVVIALLAIVTVVIGALHVWLRTTVGKFHSKVSVLGFQACWLGWVRLGWVRPETHRSRFHTSLKCP